jgi:glutamate/tyrosine decarboxylase-like PLP-dependent enzyme
MKTTFTSGVERAQCDRLGHYINVLLPALEQFNRFDGVDPSGPESSKWRTLLDQPLPERAQGLESVLSDLQAVVIPNGLRIGAPSFAAWITTAPTTAGTLASFAALVSGGQRYWVTAYNCLETIALRWLSELLGIDPRFQGLFVSGGAVGNLVALGAARQHAFEQLGIDAARDGMPDMHCWKLYASSEVHHSIFRAAGILGIGRRNVSQIPVDTEMRIDLAALEAALDRDATAKLVPIALIANAGTTNTGAIDPIAEMVAIARRRKIWLHVDGAYGLFGKLDPRVAGLFDGVEDADSVVIDPHKWLAAPTGTGAVFVRDRGLQERAFTMEAADYAEGAAAKGEIKSTFDSLGDEHLQIGPEMSAPSRGVAVWAILKEIGAEGIRDRVSRHRSFARRVFELASSDERLEPLNYPTLSICCYRYRAPDADESTLDALNAEIAHRLRMEGIVPSTTLVAGRYAIRPCFINPRTTILDVERMVERTRAIGDALTKGSRGFKRG